MLEEIIKIREEILRNGGEQTAQVWDDIIHNYQDRFNDKDFNSERFLQDIWYRIKNDKEGRDLDDLKRDIVYRIGRSNINLIPSDNTGPCKRFCLALASGTFGEKHYPTYGKIGFKGMMLKLVACWFNCLATNQETLILTSDWKQNEFDELYEPVFKASCDTHGKKAFIVVVTNSRVYLAYSR